MDLNLGKLQIVLPVDPAPVEKGAAAELAEHIKKITGEEMTVICESEVKVDQAYIYIGATAFAKANDVTFPDNAFGEGWAIEAIGGNLVLCGGAVRGALYAVYHLLEDVLGVRWWSLWEEFIPSLPAATVPADYKNSGVPAMDYRDAFFWSTKPKTPFAIRNRLNGFTVYTTPELGSKENFGHPSHTHTIDRYFPNPVPDDNPWMDYINPDRVNSFTDHPQWHALTARNKRIPGKFCMSDEGFTQEYTRRLLKSIEYSYAEADAAGLLRPRYFSISAADSSGACNCKACQESVKLRGLSGHMIRFVNKLADAVEPLYPEVSIETLCYWDYIDPPIDDTKPADNVVIRFADIFSDTLHTMNHENNAKTLARLTRWSEICKKGNLYLWDYGVTYPPNGIFPSMYRFGENFKVFAQLGLNGVFLETEHCINTDFWDMKVWLSAKFMEDPHSDPDALMDDFIYGYYGTEAGKYVRQYLDFMHEKIEASPTCYRFGATTLNADWLTAEDIMQGDALFDAAFAAANGDEILLRRLRHARHGIDRVIVENFARWAAEAAQKNIPLTLDENVTGRRLAETFAQQVELRGDWDYTGAESLKLYEKYLPDYVPPVEDTASQENLGSDVEKAPVRRLAYIASKEELDAICEDDLYVFTTDDFATFGHPTVADPVSPAGTTSVYDLQEQWSAGIISDSDLENMWAVEDEDPDKTLPFGVYCGERDRAGNPVSNLYGELRASDIITDGEYYLYKFQDLIAIKPLEGVFHSGTFHLFRNWLFQVFTLPFELEALTNKRVDFYLSMKVTGDVTCKDKANLPAYSIDRIIIADPHYDA